MPPIPCQRWRELRRRFVRWCNLRAQRFASWPASCSASYRLRCTRVAHRTRGDPPASGEPLTQPLHSCEAHFTVRRGRQLVRKNLQRGLGRFPNITGTGDEAQRRVRGGSARQSESSPSRVSRGPHRHLPHHRQHQRHRQITGCVVAPSGTTFSSFGRLDAIGCRHYEQRTEWNRRVGWCPSAGP